MGTGDLGLQLGKWDTNDPSIGPCTKATGSAAVMMMKPHVTRWRPKSRVPIVTRESARAPRPRRRAGAAAVGWWSRVLDWTSSWSKQYSSLSFFLFFPGLLFAHTLRQLPSALASTFSNTRSIAWSVRVVQAGLPFSTSPSSPQIPAAVVLFQSVLFALAFVHRWYDNVYLGPQQGWSARCWSSTVVQYSMQCSTTWPR